MGIFSKTAYIHDDVPVYKNQNNEYLYYWSDHKDWRIGPDYTSPAAGVTSSGGNDPICPVNIDLWYYTTVSGGWTQGKLNIERSTAEIFTEDHKQQFLNVLQKITEKNQFLNVFVDNVFRDEIRGINSHLLFGRVTNDRTFNGVDPEQYKSLCRDIEQSKKSSIIELSLYNIMVEDKLVYELPDLLHAIDVLQRSIRHFDEDGYASYIFSPRIFRSAQVVKLLTEKLLDNDRLIAKTAKQLFSYLTILT
eukprot:UN27855